MEVIITHCKRSGGALEKLNVGTTSVIGIVSPERERKSTIAMNMAKLGVLGLKVFYLNLETVNSSALFPSGSVGMEGAFQDCCTTLRPHKKRLRGPICQ